MNRTLILLTTALLLLLPHAAPAGISVQWGFSWGMYTAWAPDVTGDTGGVASANDVLWQLVYSPNAYAGIIGNAGEPGFGEVVLDSRITSAGGSDGYDAFLYDNGTFGTPFESAAYSSGYAYIRVFSDTAFAMGDHFYNSPVVALDNINVSDPMRMPQVIDGNTDSSAHGNRLNLTLVPEPAPAGLAAVGGLVFTLVTWCGRKLRPRR